MNYVFYYKYMTWNLAVQMVQYSWYNTYITLKKIEHFIKFDLDMMTMYFYYHNV